MYLDSQIGMQLDDDLSIRLYNQEMYGDDVWSDFLTQPIVTDKEDSPLYDLLTDEDERDIVEQIPFKLNNPIDEEMTSLGYYAKQIVKARVVFAPGNEIIVICLVEVEELSDVDLGLGHRSYREPGNRHR